MNWLRLTTAGAIGDEQHSVGTTKVGSQTLPLLFERYCMVGGQGVPKPIYFRQFFTEGDDALRRQFEFDQQKRLLFKIDGDEADIKRDPMIQTDDDTCDNVLCSFYRPPEHHDGGHEDGDDEDNESINNGHSLGDAAATQACNGEHVCSTDIIVDNDNDDDDDDNGHDVDDVDDDDASSTAATVGPTNIRAAYLPVDYDNGYCCCSSSSAHSLQVVLDPESFRSDAQMENDCCCHQDDFDVIVSPSCESVRSFDGCHSTAAVTTTDKSSDSDATDCSTQQTPPPPRRRSRSCSNHNNNNNNNAKPKKKTLKRGVRYCRADSRRAKRRKYR